MQTNDTQNMALINSTKEHIQKKSNAKRDREPGLVAFYDIQSGNGAGFLQPQSLHKAQQCESTEGVQ